MKPEITAVLEKMSRRGFVTEAFETAAELKEYIISEIPADASVGFGGSVTCVNELALYDALGEKGCSVYSHWKCAPENRAETITKANSADFYLLSANAIDYNGIIYNIDGNGNRVGAMIYGPKTVYIVVGANKFQPDEKAAIDHIKTVACPNNARRLGLETPCAKLGYCTDCRSNQRMCNFTVKLETSKGGRIHVLACAEELGF